MKNIIILFLAAIGLASCELELQRPFNYVEGVPELVTFKDQTALDFIKTKLTPAGEAANPDNLDSMYRAIQLAGLEAEYEGGNGERTFLFITNLAWGNTGANRISRDLGNVRNLALINKDRLTNLLKYHIIDAYVDQRDALPDWRQFYYFQTLVPDEVGIMSFTRNERYSININNGPNIPTTTRRGSGVYRHNYILKNGIAHYLNTYVRYQAF